MVYLPVILVLLYPWFPLIAFPSLVLPGNLWRDPRVRALAAVVVFGFVFFSAAVNKLPGYLLPLLPPAVALLGLALSHAKRPAIAIVAPMVLLGALPLASAIAPLILPSHDVGAIVAGLSTAVWLLPAAIAAVVLARLAPRQFFGAGATLAALGLLWFQFATFPQIDALASARPLWLADHPQCAPPASRDVLYGLYYYAGQQLSACPVLDQGATRVVR